MISPPDATMNSTLAPPVAPVSYVHLLGLIVGTVTPDEFFF